MCCPDCSLFTKWKNEQWRFIQEQLVQVLSKAVVDAKEEEFSQHHAALQQQLDEAQSLQAVDNKEQGQGPQDPESASEEISHRDGDDNENNN